MISTFLLQLVVGQQLYYLTGQPLHSRIENNTVFIIHHLNLLCRAPCYYSWARQSWHAIGHSAQGSLFQLATVHQWQRVRRCWYRFWCCYDGRSHSFSWYIDDVSHMLWFRMPADSKPGTHSVPTLNVINTSSGQLKQSDKAHQPELITYRKLGRSDFEWCCQIACRKSRQKHLSNTSSGSLDTVVCGGVNSRITTTHHLGQLYHRKPIQICTTSCIA